jgi:hypothetical protein
LPLCGVKGGGLQWVRIPPGTGLLQPEAIGAVVCGNAAAEAFDGKGRLGRLREPTGRNASERRAGLEKQDVGADPAKGWGRPRSQNSPASNNSRLRSHRGNDDGMSEQEDHRNTGDPRR